MKVLFTCGREPAYVRNAMMLQALRNNGAEVVECVDASPRYPRRLLAVAAKLLRQRTTPCDLVFVGFLGHPLIFPVRLWYRKPVLFDAFISVFDKLCNDSRTFSPRSLPGRLLFQLDRVSCRLADRILLDTEAHIDYFVDTFGLPREKFARVLVGADDSIFRPLPPREPDGKFRVFYYASYLPLHGTEFVVRAARLLAAHPEIEFRVVGTGPEYRRVRHLADSLEVRNVEFIEWVPYRELPREMAQADLCLGGHFSASEKAARVIAGKSYQFIAMARPVVVGECPANRELFSHGESAYFVRMADADALAQAILALRQDPALRERIAQGGFRVFREHGSRDAIASQLKPVLAAFGKEPKRG